MNVEELQMLTVNEVGKIFKIDRKSAKLLMPDMPGFYAFSKCSWRVPVWGLRKYQEQISKQFKEITNEQV